MVGFPEDFIGLIDIEVQIMKNVYDIKQEKGLCFILANEMKPVRESYSKRKAAIILYLYYFDTLENYFKYISCIDTGIDVYIVTPLDSVRDKVKDYIKNTQRTNINIIMKPNTGRDISGLLIAAGQVVPDYEYVCFVHDKKEHSAETKDDTTLWVENIWGNLIGGTGYIQQIIELFEQNKELGVLAPPAPIGVHFCTWYGYGWHGSFRTTKNLADRLGLKCDLQETKPPITIGTALWFRTAALEKLFRYAWTYEDFDDVQLAHSDYLSYGVERIFAYVAQDAGYDTGEVMSSEYARKQNLFLQSSLTEIFHSLHAFFPFPTLAEVRKLPANLQGMLEAASAKKNIYLYGAGDAGRFCLSWLRKNGIEPKAFIVSSGKNISDIDKIPVINISDYTDDENNGIIVTVVKETPRVQIENILKERKIDNYFIFWK